MHYATDWIVATLSQQVNVIRHQAIRVQVERQPGLLRFEQPKQLVIILIGAEYELAIIASRDYVIQSAFDFDSRPSRHRTGRVPPGKENRNIAGLTLNIPTISAQSEPSAIPQTAISHSDLPDTGIDTASVLDCRLALLIEIQKTRRLLAHLRTQRLLTESAHQA